MTAPQARQGELEAFAAAILKTATVRVPLERILSHWSDAAPRLAGDSASIPALQTALATLAATGVIRFPVRSWDRSHTPPLPNFVTVDAARRAPGDRPWLRFPWQPQLGWAASLTRLGSAQFSQLVAVNDWLTATAGHEPSVIPHRFRSAQLFGDEKALDTLAASSLFGSKRLTYELLRCTRYAPPLPAAAVGAGPDIIAVENSDAYWAVTDALHASPGHRIRAVVWGCGRLFPSQVSSLAIDVAGTGPVTGTIWYWGDLDPTGLAIASDAAAQAEIHGLGAVVPAEPLWAAFADCPVSEPGSHRWPEPAPAPGWLGDKLWDVLDGVRTAGGRVAQEAVDPAAIAAWALGA